MKRILIWDIPVRLFHWLLAGSFFAAFGIANTVDDESTLFAAHMWLGGIMVFMVLLRLIWGLVGSRYARFRSFASPSPRSLLGYLADTIRGGGERHLGHNPGSSFAIIAIFVLVIGLGLTGALMSSGGEAFEEVHEVLAWVLLAVAAVHVAGVLWHTLRKRENIVQSMVDGRKTGPAEAAIASPRPMVGLLFLALTGLWAGGLYRGFDPATSQVAVPLTGVTLQLGESEEHEGEEYEGDEYESDGDEDEDD